jgi:hypothetical protein
MEIVHRIANLFYHNLFFFLFQEFYRVWKTQQPFSVGPKAFLCTVCNLNFCVSSCWLSQLAFWYTKPLEGGFKNEMYFQICCTCHTYCVVLMMCFVI